MKKFILSLILVSLVASMGFATDMTLLFSDSITAADSADVRNDTVLSVVYDIRDYKVMNFYSYLRDYLNLDDTNFVDDSFFVYLQFSADGYTWEAGDTLCLDTFLDSDSGWSWLGIDRDTANIGNFIRVELVHYDSIGIGAADSALVNRDAPFWKELYVWITGTKR